MGKTEERTSKKDKKSGEKKSKKDKPSKAPKNEEQILEARVESPADEPMAIDGPLDEEPKQSKKSSKKRRLEQDDAQLDTPADTTNSEAPKKKKKRKDMKTSDSGEPNAMSIEEPEVAPSENRKTGVEDVSPSVPKRESKEEKKSRKDRKKASRAEPIDASDSEPTPAPTSEEAPAKPSSEPLTEAEEKKKRKKERKAKKAKSTECDLPSSPKKSKSKSSEKEASSPSTPRKNKTQFPNPEEDESLNPQALKALEYAFTQFNNPSEWKFNKAKQNWILRNVWSGESIPDTYLALAIKYIAQIQGGSREKLKETCRAAIVEPAPVVDVENTETTEVEAAGDGSKPKSILKPTSGQPVAGAIIAAVPAVPEVPTVNVKKERAQAILDALAESS
ncbi:hypothetical protein D9611_007666 [Ephemerocybe angulata]|uniref:WKF domain-containing protein n=1 Tax=Ephemerocybe angulata TaxID=980116 RepID=A0A8H5FCL9_9AGAR|nr:hypothetical protein D9611_007666 [Tulosesus angulatus]